MKSKCLDRYPIIPKILLPYLICCYTRQSQCFSQKVDILYCILKAKDRIRCYLTYIFSTGEPCLEQLNLVCTMSQMEILEDSRLKLQPATVCFTPLGNGDSGRLSRLRETQQTQGESVNLGRLSRLRETQQTQGESVNLGRLSRLRETQRNQGD